MQNPFSGATRHPVPDSRAEETGRQVGEAGRDTRVTFTFREWASAKATGLSATQCLYRCSSVAQLNECGKAHSCDAATYSVIGTLLRRSASNNTSSRTGKWRFSVRFCGTSVPEMTSNTLPVHVVPRTLRRAEIARGWQNRLSFALTTLVEPGFPHANDHRPLDRQPV